MERLKFELANNDVTVQHVSHYPIVPSAFGTFLGHHQGLFVWVKSVFLKEIFWKGILSVVQFW